MDGLSNVCKHPKCFRSFRGPKGLRIHLGMVKKCAAWYKRLVKTKEKHPQPDAHSDTLYSSKHEVSFTEETPTQTYPWTTKTPVRPGEIFNPSGIDLPWTSTIELQNHFGNPSLPLPCPHPCPEYPAAEEDAEIDRMLLDTFEDTFLRFDEKDDEQPVRKDTQRTNSFPDAGKSFGQGFSLLEQIKQDRVELEKEGCFYFPFANADDFAVAAWLSKSGASKASIDKFLKLPFVTKTGLLSFRSADEMHIKIAQLPSPPVWLSRVVKVPGGTTATPLKLLYRDGLELFKFLFANPVFANHQNLVPKTVWADFENDIKIFDEPPTGSFMFNVQQKVGKGETLGLVIFGSDKTHLTNNTGDKKDHCVYLSCGNISKDIRTKMSSRCWVKVAQIPVAHFEGVSKERHGVLCQRLYHLCMDIVTDSLKKCSHAPILMPDAKGVLRLVRTVILAHIADHPEQQLIACAAGDASPISIARLDALGLETCQELRKGETTLGLIKEVTDVQGISAAHISLYVTAARKLGLNGVDKPFWRDWKFADPSEFLTPDALHQWHRFFWDHPMKWVRQLIGDAEIDRRYMALQKHVGRPHFRRGFTAFSQHTGREYRELQASFIAVISGHKSITPGIMRALRAILDFIYIGQFETHSTATLRQLESALVRFHAEKHHLSNAGVRDGPRRLGLFNIKKVELMQHVTRFISLAGSVQQYSAEQTERLHILMSKIPYRATNRKNYEEQMCRFLDRDEKLALFEMYIQWRATSSKGVDAKTVARELTCIELDDVKQDSELRVEDFSMFASIFLPKSAKDVFEESKYDVPRNETTAFILTTRITRGDASVRAISRIYDLPKLSSLLVERSMLNVDSVRRQVRPTVKLLDCWDRVRLQLRSQDNNNVALQPLTVMACPPNKDVPLGLYNFVLVKDREDSTVENIRGHFVAQLRLIFQPLYHSSTTRDPEYLAYVEPFKVAEPFRSVRGAAGCLVNQDSLLIHVRRVREPDGSRRGLIVNLTDIWTSVDLVPNFHDRCPPEWTTDTATSLADEFFVNSFHTKQQYISLR